MEGFIISTSLSGRSNQGSEALITETMWPFCFLKCPVSFFTFFPHDTKDYAQYYKEKQVKNKKLVEFFYVV
jgi:hypothetical protein